VALYFLIVLKGLFYIPFRISGVAFTFSIGISI